MKLSIVKTGRFKLDGGAMFGVVPKRMWQNMNPPDEHNMCTWHMNALLIQTGKRNILIDTGLGNKQDERFRSHFEPHGPESLPESLIDAGIAPESVTDVLLTHLHFDHCGGALWRNADTGQVTPTFPNALYWTNQRHLDWALNPNEREKASFLKENFVPLLDEGRLRSIDVRQGITFDDAIRLRFTFGHTEAMMLPVIQANGKTVVYCADTLPSQWHVGLPYIMAYDIRPLQSLKEKTRLLTTAARENHILVLEHDPVAEAITVHPDGKGRIVVQDAGKLVDLLGGFG